MHPIAFLWLLTHLVHPHSFRMLNPGARLSMMMYSRASSFILMHPVVMNWHASWGGRSNYLQKQCRPFVFSWCHDAERRDTITFCYVTLPCTTRQHATVNQVYISCQIKWQSYFYWYPVCLSCCCYGWSATAAVQLLILFSLLLLLLLPPQPFQLFLYLSATHHVLSHQVMTTVLWTLL